jgi:hypothetical protein
VARSKAVQEEIPGTESPNRDPELHALGLELYDLQTERMRLTKDEKTKREEIAAALHSRKQVQYDCDGVHLWLEPTEKVKVKMGNGNGREDEDGEED